MTGTRPIVMLAYLFPPLGGGGVRRTLKFVKYLPSYGFAPVVITTGSYRYPARDETLLGDLPSGLRVFRPRELPIGKPLEKLSRLLEIAGIRNAPEYVLWPDRWAGWIPVAVGAALRAVRIYRPAALYSTSMPYSAHLAALVAARLTGTPWVADFRDEWAANPHIGPRAPLPEALAERAERAIVETAERIVVTADHFIVGGTGPTSPKRVTITNGVDEEDLAALATAEPPRDRFRITFVGTMYSEIDCAPVFTALRRLVARGAIDPAQVEVRVVGGSYTPINFDTGPIAMRRTGLVDHPKALREMTEATVLLSYVPLVESREARGKNTPFRNTPGKIFEYLASGRPVLSVAHRDNLAFRLVDDLQAGACAEPGDLAAIERAIERLYVRWKSTGLPSSPQVRDTVLKRYSSRRLTRRLAAIVDEVATPPR